MLTSYDFQSIHSVRWKFMKKFFDSHLIFFSEFSVTILSCTLTLILFVLQFKAQTLMTSQSGSCIEYIIPSYSTLVLLLHTLRAKNLDSLTCFNKILLLNTSNVFFEFYSIFEAFWSHRIV